MLDGDITRIQRLRNTNREFAALEQRHRDLDRELDGLMKRRVLTADGELRKKTVQKHKLATKDRMHDMLRRLVIAAPMVTSGPLKDLPVPPAPSVRGRARWADVFMSRDEPAGRHH